MEWKLLVKQDAVDHKKRSVASPFSVLSAAVERGLRYGRRTGEIKQDEDKRFCL